MLSRFPIGMAAVTLALGIAGTRLIWLLRLVRSGAPDPRRTSGWSARLGAELREVVGQRKLMRWTVPGLAHAITFWGFIVLLITVVEAFGDLFNPKFAIPVIGHSEFIGFVEDLFACAVLVCVVVFVVIRTREDPQRIERKSRFFGSHTKAAWLTLAGIASVVLTLLVYRAAQTNSGNFPYGPWAFASHGLGKALRPLGYEANRTIETVFVDLNVVIICGFLVFVVYSKHLHIFLAPVNVAFSRQPRALGSVVDDPDHGH